jgi:hypothetical protein
MRQLNGVYTQKFNRRHGRVGHVFQGRYKAILVEKDSHLLELARYVVLNPVRAGMVKDTENWEWSSYRGMIDHIAPQKWLQTDWLLGQFGTNRVQSIIGYKDFVRAGVGLPSVWGKLKNQIYLGDENFVRAMQGKPPPDSTNIKEIPRAHRRSIGTSLDHYVVKFENQKLGMKAAYETGDYTMQQIAEAFGVHYSTVSRALKATFEL